MTIIEAAPTASPTIVAPEALEAAAVYDRAADIIDRDGWAPDGVSYPRRCVVMALCAACETDFATPAGVDQMRDAVRRVAEFLGVEGLPEWNDRQPNAQVVTDALRSCATALRSGLL